MKLTLTLLSFSFFIVLLVAPVSAQRSAPGLMRTPSPRPVNALSADKIRSCEARETAIQTRATQLERQVNGMLATFDSIANRVRTYYGTTEMTLANYDSLIATTETKRTAVLDSLTTAKTEMAGFSCAGDDPKMYLNRYRLQMQQVTRSLSEYRTAIKNLIVAVRSTAPDEAEPQLNERGNARPSVSPRVLPSNRGRSTTL